jgi:hypothetical protein
MDCRQPNFQGVFSFFLQSLKVSITYSNMCLGSTRYILFAQINVFVLAKNLPNFDLNIMILTYTKDFSLKKLPKIARFFEKNNSKLLDFSHNLQKVAKNIGGILFFSLLSYLGCSQAWLNCFMDDCHFGYITN